MRDSHFYLSPAAALLSFRSPCPAAFVFGSIVAALCCTLALPQKTLQRNEISVKTLQLQLRLDAPLAMAPLPVSLSHLWRRFPLRLHSRSAASSTCIFTASSRHLPLAACHTARCYAQLLSSCFFFLFPWTAEGDRQTDSQTEGH